MILLQMIDRLWAQWQLMAPQNALSFTGGSVPARETYAIYQTFPNGGPPFLNVGETGPALLITHHSSYSSSLCYPVMDYGRT